MTPLDTSREDTMARPTTVDEYVAQFPESVESRLGEIRSLCRAAVPSALEHLKWGHPAYVHPDGVILFMFSGHKAHASLAFTPSTREAFAPQLRDYRTGKGTIALPYDAPLPTELMTRMIEHRVSEYETEGVKWM
jgi:uncharacterized protein YdhG (YjbR/CyaY superfamily)